MLRRRVLHLMAAAPLMRAAEHLAVDDGYRGIWYYNQPSKDEYVYKYSGGFATYPQQQSPIAIYSKEAGKTFFCYGGTVKGKRELLHMVSYFDHETGMVPRPRILLNKQTEDAHDNPVMSIDGKGHIWIFSNAHGTTRPSFIHRSRRPHSIEAFDLVRTTNFSYGHPWHIPGRGFLFLHTNYEKAGRSLVSTTSPDGVEWETPRPLARMDLGHYQVTCRGGARVATAFNYHPLPIGLNARTNLYYLETADMGQTWKTVDGGAVETPLLSPKSAALVHDYRAEGLLVYLKTIDFDAQGRPVILYLTSKGYEAGPRNDPRQWWTARWDGRTWEILPVTQSDHNYDFGPLYIEADGVWRVIAPTDPGPQPYGTGGEMVMWTSADRGRHWTRTKALTRSSARNHTYARKPVDAHPAFYALWADGDARRPSDSSLYFTDRAGSHVWRLPPVMRREFEKPEPVA